MQRQEEPIQNIGFDNDKAEAERKLKHEKILADIAEARIKIEELNNQLSLLRLSPSFLLGEQQTTHTLSEKQYCEYLSIRTKISQIKSKIKSESSLNEHREALLLPPEERIKVLQALLKKENEAADKNLQGMRETGKAFTAAAKKVGDLQDARTKHSSYFLDKFGLRATENPANQPSTKRESSSRKEEGSFKPNCP